MSDSYASSFDDTLSPLGQKLVALSSSNTQSLLAEASRFTHSGRADASVLLDRLKQLNPVVGAQFQLKDDVLSELRLRMIIANNTAPRDMSSFIIISYCWHYSEWPLAPAAEPIAPGWEVSLPMVDATMKLRESAEEGIWLDKLCINQSADREKQVHIGAMDIIYRSARRVIILLEDVQLTQEEEDAGLAYADFYEAMCRKVREENLEGASKMAFVEGYFPDKEASSPNRHALTAGIRLFIMRILGARWFSRAWCAHESRLSPHPKQNNPLFLCYGHDGRVLSFEFRCIHYIATYLEQSVGQSSEPEFNLSGTNFSQLQKQCWLIQRVMPGYWKRTAMQHICTVMASGCLKKEDLISIALNTSNTPLVFTGRLNAIEDAVWIFALVVLATGDPVPLIMDGDGLRLKDGTTQKETISWLALPTEGVFNDTLRMSLTDSVTAVTGGYIELDLIVFPSLPVEASEQAFNTARRMFEEIYPHDLAQAASNSVQRDMELLKSEVVRARGDDGLLKSSHIAWLGHAIDCGLEWTCKFPDKMMQETQEGEWIHRILGQDADARLEKVAKSLFAYFVQNGAVVGSETKVDLMHGLTRFLTCILDPRFPLIATTRPRRLPCGPGDFAFTSSTSNRSWIAVPVSTAHLPLWQERAWIIEPFDAINDAPEDPKSHLPYLGVDGKGVTQIKFPVSTSDHEDKRRGRLPEGTWKLRGRARIIGSKPLVKPVDLREAGEGVLLLKKQRVYGAKNYDWTAISAVAQELKAAVGSMK